MSSTPSALRSLFDRLSDASRLPASMLTTRAARIIGYSLAAIVLLAELAIVFRSVANNPYWLTSTDFGAYVRASLALAHGRNPYDPALYPPLEFYGAKAIDRVAYPPTLPAALAPFALISPTFLRYGWVALSMLLAGASIALVLRNFGNRVSWAWIAVVVLFVFSTNIVRNDLYHGQVNFALLFILTIGLLLYARGQGQAAGVVWAFMIVVKPFLGLLVIYLLWKRAWRPAIACLATSAALFIGSFLLTLPTGLDAFKGWLDATAYYTTPIYAARPDDLSLYGFILRLFVANPYTNSWTASWLVARVAQGLVIVAIVTLFLLVLSRRDVIAQGGPEAQRLLLAEVGFVLALGMSYGPVTETDHLFLLFPGFVGVLALAWMRWRTSGDRAQRAAWAAAAVAWIALFALICSPVRIGFGLPSPLAWTPVSGLAILLTGVASILLFIAAASLGAALYTERYGTARLRLPALLCRMNARVRVAQ